VCAATSHQHRADGELHLYESCLVFIRCFAISLAHCPIYEAGGMRAILAAMKFRQVLMARVGDSAAKGKRLLFRAATRSQMSITYVAARKVADYMRVAQVLAARSASNFHRASAIIAGVSCGDT